MSKKKMTFKEYVESVDNGEPLDKVRIKMFSDVDKLMKSLEESSNEMLSDAMLKLFEIKDKPEQVKELIEDALKLYEKSLKAYEALDSLWLEAGDQLGRIMD